MAVITPPVPTRTKASRVPCKIACYATIAVEQSLIDATLGPAVRVTIGGISGDLTVKTPGNSVGVAIPASVQYAWGGVIEHQLTAVSGAATAVVAEWAEDC